MQKLLLSILTTFSALSAYATGGFYAGIGAGYTAISNTPQSGYTFNNNSNGSQIGNAATLALYGGYDFNRIIGIQLDYDLPFNTQIAGSYNISQQLFGGSLILHLPFSIFADALSGFSLFAKGGIGYSSFNFSNVQPTCSNCVNPPGNAYAFVPIYGFGAEYGFSNIGIRLEWDNNGNVTAPNLGSNQVLANSNMYLLSVLYHF